MCCITSSSLSLKWSGEKLDSFKPKRGLRQGDPLSPYLFVLCMEKLSLMIQDQVICNVWKHVKIYNGGPCFSHLFLFAGDCLLFTEAKCSQVKLVRDVLQQFCPASGLKINIQKSKFTTSSNVPWSKTCKLVSSTL